MSRTTTTACERCGRLDYPHVCDRPAALTMKIHVRGGITFVCPGITFGILPENTQFPSNSPQTKEETRG